MHVTKFFIYLIIKSECIFSLCQNILLFKAFTVENKLIKMEVKMASLIFKVDVIVYMYELMQNETLDTSFQ